MKKFFSFVAAVLFAGSMMADVETVYNWADNVGSSTMGTSVEATTVKIHTNTDAVNCIKFSNSYVYADGKYLSIKPAEGGFKAGDVLSVAIVFNNADDTKYAQVDLRAANGDTRIWLSDSASTINGRTSAAEPIVQTYTLEADQDSLLLGRYGNTAMCVTLLSVTREAAPVTPAGTTCAEVYNMAKNDVVDLLNDVVVTYSNGANVWVKDETASMLIYLPSGFTNNFQAGDVLSGVAGVVDIYQTLVYEVKPSADQAAAIVATPGEAPAPSQAAVIEASDVNKYVILPGFSIEGAFTADAKTSLPAVLGENTVTIYNNFKFAYTFEAGKTYDIIGVVSAYKGNPQVYFISAEEAEAEGEEINITISSLTNPGQVLYADAIASYGYWDIYAYNDQYKIEISNTYTTEAAGTYTIDDLDAKYTYIVPAEGDTVHFTAGQVVLSITDGVVNVAGQLTGDDNNIYNVNLTYKDPVAEQTVNVNIPKGVLFEGYATYGLYAVYGYAEDSTYVQLAIWTEAGFEGEFTEDDLDNKYVGSGLKDAAGNTQQIYTAAITVTPGAIEGAYTITADLLCYNNTLYKVTMKIGEEQQGINNVEAAVEAIKRIVNGQLVIEKAGKTYNVNGAVVR